MRPWYWILLTVLALLSVTGAGAITTSCPDTTVLTLAGPQNSHALPAGSGQPYSVCLPDHISTTNSTTGPGDIYLQGAADGGYHVSRTGGDIAINFSSSQYTVKGITESCTGACLFLFSMAQETQSHVGQEGYGTDIYLNLSADPFSVRCDDCLSPDPVQQVDSLVTVAPEINGPPIETGQVCTDPSCAPTTRLCTLGPDRTCAFSPRTSLLGSQPVWLVLDSGALRSSHLLEIIEIDRYLTTTPDQATIRVNQTETIEVTVHNPSDRVQEVGLTVSGTETIYPALPQGDGGQQMELTLGGDSSQSMPLTLQARHCFSICSTNVTITVSSPDEGPLQELQLPVTVTTAQSVQAPGLKTVQLAAVFLLGALLYGRKKLT